MALPAGIQTCEVNFGPFTTYLGEPLTGTVDFVPSRSIIWIATGTPIMNKTETITLNEDGVGVIYLPYTDQAGFADGGGNSITNWTYRAVVKLNGAPSPPAFSFQLPSGPVSVDLDLTTPSTSSFGVTVALPEVISVNGMTGAVIIPGGGGESTLAGFTALIGNGSASSFEVTHSLSSYFVMIEVIEESTGQTVYPVVIRNTVNKATIYFGTTIPTPNQYRVLVVKAA